MKLISAVEIKGFRSIRSSRIEGLGDFAAFAGLNNSGKSNILRAMNLFFNEESDEGVPVNVDRDYYRPDLRMKKAKEITVSVTFSLPGHFRFRRGLDAVNQLLGGTTFTISKRWRRNEPAPAYFLGGTELELPQRPLIEQFLQLIKFRYVPNRVLPMDVVRKEHQALRDVLVRRLGSRAGVQSETFQAIRQTSDTVIRALAKRIHDASPDIGDVRLATPTSWSDMVFAFGYKLGHDGVEVDDSVQGSGIQSLLMLETLYLIDRDYFQKFGWRQAAIWAVEEPESSLHTSLEARVASYLSQIATDSSSRLQVVSTTHSDLMLQYASKTFIVKKSGWETVCEPTANPREAIERLSRDGISRWTHPVLYYPLDPLILVEGKYDAAFLEAAFKHVRHNRPIRVSYLEKLEGGARTGGVDDLYQYVKANTGVIQSRQKDARVVILLDWDAARKADQFRKLLPGNDSFKVMAWPDTAFNPKLGRSFRGIERHLSDRLIGRAEKKGAPVFRRGNLCSVEPADYGQVKEILHSILTKKGLRKDDVLHAKDFLQVVVDTAEGRA